jgi:hypothetical protein
MLANKVKTTLDDSSADVDWMQQLMSSAQGAARAVGIGPSRT